MVDLALGFGGRSALAAVHGRGMTLSDIDVSFGWKLFGSIDITPESMERFVSNAGGSLWET